MIRISYGIGTMCLFLVLAGPVAAQPAGDTAEMVKVLVAKKPIPNMAFVKNAADYFEIQRKPEDGLPKNYISDLNDKELKDGFRVARKMSVGNYLTRDDVLPKGVGGLEVLVPQGMRVVAIKVNFDQLASGFILPGARVDVISTVRRKKEAVAQTILQDVTVLAVDTHSMRNPEGTHTIIGQTVSLAVKPEEAEKLAVAVKIGEIRLTLRPLGDDKKLLLPGTKVGNLPKPPKGPEEKVADPPSVPPLPTLPPLEKKEPEAVAPPGLAVPKGMRAVAIEVSVDQLVDGFVLPGSKIDVMWTTRTPNGEAETRLLFKNMQVLAVDTQSARSPEGNNTILGQTVTIAVTPEGALQLARTLEEGELRLGVRPNK